MSWLAVWLLLATAYLAVSALVGWLSHGTFRFGPELLAELAVVPFLQVGLLALLRAVRRPGLPPP